MFQQAKLTAVRILLMCTGLIVWSLYAAELYVEAFSGSAPRGLRWLLTDLLEGFAVGAVCFGLTSLLGYERSRSSRHPSS